MRDSFDSSQKRIFYPLVQPPRAHRFAHRAVLNLPLRRRLLQRSPLVQLLLGLFQHND